MKIKLLASTICSILMIGSGYSTTINDQYLLDCGLFLTHTQNDYQSQRISNSSTDDESDNQKQLKSEDVPEAKKDTVGINLSLNRVLINRCNELIKQNKELVNKLQKYKNLNNFNIGLDIISDLDTYYDINSRILSKIKGKKYTINKLNDMYTTILSENKKLNKTNIELEKINKTLEQKLQKYEKFNNVNLINRTDEIQVIAKEKKDNKIENIDEIKNNQEFLQKLDKIIEKKTLTIGQRQSYWPLFSLYKVSLEDQNRIYSLLKINYNLCEKFYNVKQVLDEQQKYLEELCKGNRTLKNIEYKYLNELEMYFEYNPQVKDKFEHAQSLLKQELDKRRKRFQSGIEQINFTKAEAQSLDTISAKYKNKLMYEDTRLIWFQNKNKFRKK